MIKTNLSVCDKIYFANFKKQYPGWEIYRLEDNSLVFYPPLRS